jgi:CDGSH-type Zn-finger protein
MSDQPKPEIPQKAPVGLALEPGTYWWCACGKSQNQPWCDGSHKGSGFTPKKVDITEAKTYWMCNCKHSNNAPFCDGTHKKL